MQQIDFASTMEDYQDEYIFRVEVKRTADFKGKKSSHVEKKIKVTEVYDKKGYQHRYVVKKFLDEVLEGLEQFDSKKSK